MNRLALSALADFIESAPPDPQFSMSYWSSTKVNSAGHNCGTTCCIGGFANMLFDHGALSATTARLALGLDEVEADELFYQSRAPAGVNLSSTTRAMAVATLRRAALTGEIVWTTPAPSFLNKPWRTMTDDELAASWKHWDDKIQAATSWGAALAAANEFRHNAQAEITRRKA